MRQRKELLWDSVSFEITFENVICRISHLLCVTVADGSQTTYTQTLERPCERNPLPLCIYCSHIFHLSSCIAVNEEWEFLPLGITPHYPYVPSESFLQCSGQGGFYREGHQQPTPSANWFPCTVSTWKSNDSGSYRKRKYSRFFLKFFYYGVLDCEHKRNCTLTCTMH